MHDSASSMRVEARSYFSVFERAPDAMALVDEHGNLLEVNQAASNLPGVDVESLFTSHAHRAELGRLRGELRANGRASVELQVGSVETGAKTRVLRIEGASDGPRLILSIRDVTEGRRREEEIRHLRRLESVGFLTASVVHDFNNLLTPIVCLGALLAREVAPASHAAELTEEIRGAAERAASLVRQVVGIVRRDVSAPERACLNTIVADSRTLVKRVVGDDTEIVLMLDEALGDAVVDREELEHVLLNLAANARDAMPNGGRLTMRTANVTLGEREASEIDGADARAYVVLAVTDTGVGMSAEVRERIFERFFTTKEMGRGTGLGLAAAQRFVQRSQGCIRVHSELGQGTTVAIYLPRAGVSSPPAVARRPISELPGGTETVLVVEDDPRVLAVVSEVLVELGYTVLPASSGQEALAQAARHEGEIALVLADLVMPGMDGRAIVDALRETSRVGKVLYMSGHTDRAIEAHGVRADDEALIRKAFTPAELARKVRRVLDGAAAK